MTVEQLIKCLHAQPFRRFRLHLADGRALAVDHPDFIARSPTGRTATVYGKDDAAEIVDLYLVTSLEFLPPRRRSAG